MFKIDLDFLDNQIDNIDNTHELSKLYFSIKKVRSKEEEKLIELKKQYEINDNKLNMLLEKITIILIGLTVYIDTSDEETSNSSDSDVEINSDDVDINTEDIELISSDEDIELNIAILENK